MQFREREPVGTFLWDPLDPYWEYFLGGAELKMDKRHLEK